MKSGVERFNTGCTPTTFNHLVGCNPDYSPRYQYLKPVLTGCKSCCRSSLPKLRRKIGLSNQQNLSIFPQIGHKPSTLRFVQLGDEHNYTITVCMDWNIVSG